jgi:hydroxypyruvate reductase
MKAVEQLDFLRRVFQHALSECSIQKAFEKSIDCRGGVLRVCDDLYDLRQQDRVFVVSIGKAAHSMAEALSGQAGSGLSGIVVGPTPPDTMLPGFEYFLGGHPLPNANSLRAADSILRNLRSLTADSLVIFLLSGGGSALVERPIAGISLDDLITTYRALVHSGAPIAEINAIRKHLSAIKGGRLAQAAGEARQVSVMVSDVPDSTLDSLASGPTMPDSSTVEDCYAIAARHGMLPQFPSSVRDLFTERALEETPKAYDAAFARARYWTLLSSSTAQRAAAEAAATAGFAVEVDNSCDDWDYARAADYLLERLRTLRRASARVCLISGGEVAVKVVNGGTGGRNQQFALYCATKIAGENIAVLSAGTDGIDGNSVAAGAAVDGSTVARAQAQGFSVVNEISGFNAFPVFETSGEAIITGPTGNNVRDIRVLLAW